MAYGPASDAARGSCCSSSVVVGGAARIRPALSLAARVPSERGARGRHKHNRSSTFDFVGRLTKQHARRDWAELVAMAAARRVSLPAKLPKERLGRLFPPELSNISAGTRRQVCEALELEHRCLGIPLADCLGDIGGGSRRRAPCARRGCAEQRAHRRAQRPPRCCISMAAPRLSCGKGSSGGADGT